MKLKEFGPPGGGGACVPRAPLLRSATDPPPPSFMLSHGLGFVRANIYQKHLQVKNSQIFKRTRMHSSRMRTARSSSHQPGGGGGLPQCMLGYTNPPGCGPGEPPPRCGPRDLKGMLRYHPTPRVQNS